MSASVMPICELDLVDRETWLFALCGDFDIVRDST